MYKHHCRFQKIDIDENKPTVIYKKLKKIVLALGLELGSRAVEFRDLTVVLV